MVGTVEEEPGVYHLIWDGRSRWSTFTCRLSCSWPWSTLRTASATPRKWRHTSGRRHGSGAWEANAGWAPLPSKATPYLRAMLEQAGWLMLRSRAEDPLVLWARRVAERRGRGWP